MDFRLGAARELYASNVHPRVMLGPKDLAELRERVKRGGARRLMAAVRARTRALADQVLGAGDLAGVVSDWNRPGGELGARIVSGIEDMALAGALDGDERTIEAVRRVLLVAADADPLSRTDHPSRRLAYAAGGLSLAYDLIHPHLSGGDRRSYTNWAGRVALPHIMQSIQPQPFYTHAGGNVAVVGMGAGIAAALGVRGDPGVPSQRKNLELLTSYAQASLRAAIGPDGYPEEDIGYGTEVTTVLAYSTERLRRAGLYDVYADCPRFTKFGRAILHFVQPWGMNLSNTGDFMDTFGRRVFVLARLATKTKDPTLLWLLGTLANERDRGRPEFVKEVLIRRGVRVPAGAAALMVLDDIAAPVHPARAKVATQFRDRARGLVSFRSGWKADDTLVIFDGSQRSGTAQGHAHASAGNFTLSAVGEYFAIDCGRYCNEQREHNVVLIKGRSGYSHERQWTATPYAGILTDYVPGRFCDFAAVDSAQQTQCIWARRHLGLVKGARPYLWTVEDVNSRNDYTEFWWTLNTHPQNTIETFDDRATVHGCRQGNALDVHFALPAPDVYPKPHTLKLSRDVNTCAATDYVGDPRKNSDGYATRGVHGSVMVRPRLIAKVKGYNGRFMSIMIPRAGKERPPVVRRLASLPGALALRVTFADVEDTVIFAYEHGLLEAGDVEGRGRWCVVRRARKTGHVLGHELGQGTRLAVAGRTVVQ